MQLQNKVKSNSKNFSNENSGKFGGSHLGIHTVAFLGAAHFLTSGLFWLDAYVSL